MDESQSDLTIGWLNKLIALAQWDKRFPLYLARLFQDPDAYGTALDKIREASAGTSQTPESPQSPNGLLSETEWHDLYSGIVHSKSLTKLFRGSDPFAGATAQEMSLLAEVSDITTDSKTMVYSRNGAFLAIVEALRQSSKLDVDKHVQEGLEKFFALFEENPTIAEMLNELAGSDDWQSVMASLRDQRDYTEGQTSPASKALAKWNETLTPGLRAQQLFKPTHLSRLPRDLIRLGWEGRHLFDEARNSLALDDVQLTAAEKRKRISAAALPLFRLQYSDRLAGVQSGLQLLETVARNYIQRRKFAKLDAFVYNWPHVAKLAMENYDNLEFVEDCLVIRRQLPSDADLDAKEARELYQACQKDRDLIRFLRIRPYFSEIDDNELRRYKPLAPVVIAPPTPTVPESAAIVTPRASAKPQAPQFSAAAQPGYQNCYLRIQTRLGAKSAAREQMSFAVELELPGQKESMHGPAFSIPEVLIEMLKIVGVSEDELQTYLKDAFSSGANGEAVLARAGTYLLARILDEDARLELAKLMNSEQRVRLIIQMDSAYLTYLPWEWLARPDRPELIVRNPNFSIVRYFFPLEASAQVPAIQSLDHPLRVLGVLLEPLMEQSWVALKSVGTHPLWQPAALKEDHRSVESMELLLKELKPQIVHLEGRAFYSVEADKLVTEIPFPLQGPGSGSIGVGAFGDLLKKYDVPLLVIGRNDNGRLSDNPISALAVFLAASQVPAVIAPVRGIDEATALTFVTEFYKSFVSGNTLEVALTYARRKVSSRGGDWSAFALFGNPASLDSFHPFSLE